jgi:putative endonuclease
MNPRSSWWVYFVRMPNQGLYCGITTDVTRRFQQHQAGTGAKALRGKHPLSLVWSTQVGDRSLALKIEYRIKQWPKQRKEAIVSANWPFETLMEQIKISDQ